MRQRTTPNSLHLRKGRVLDPGSGLDAQRDIVVERGRIARVGQGLATPAGAEVVDARDLLVTPGFIDIHVHLREPGEEYKEDIASGTAAAAAGGFTAICPMPNTRPPNDCRAVTELILARAAEVGRVRVYPVGAISRGLAGRELTEVGDLAQAGVVALSDDGHPIMDAGLMRRALEYGRRRLVGGARTDLSGLTASEARALFQRAARPNVMIKVPATRAGLPGQPSQAEDVMVARDLSLVELTGARYHVAHVSTAPAVEMVRRAKARGLPVTAEAAPQHFTLTDEACLTYDTSTKCYPPLRGDADVEAIREGLADGTIDAVATDHAPHSSIEKEVEFSCAAFGMIGLETALPLLLRLVDAGQLSLRDAVERLTAGPARVLGLPGGALVEGAPADITCVDLDRRWTVDPERLVSRSKNTPFAGWEMKGQVVLTLVAGVVVHDARAGGPGRGP